MSLTDLSRYARNDYSQFGEDGILERLLDVIGVERGYFVEFGAWDGQHLSNTYALYRKGWSGCYIEGDPDRFVDLQRNMTSERVTNVNAFVTAEGENSFDNIMSRINAPQNLDLLSIDIDSDDLAIWRSVKNFVPKIVVIEYNPTIPFDTEFENPPGKNWGNSALSLLRLADKKGYDLVCGTTTNLIFLEKKINQSVGLPIYDLDLLPKTRFFWAYDGSLLRSDGRSVQCNEIFFLPWGRAVAFQPLPAFLRKYVDRRSPISIARILTTGFTSMLMRPVSMARFLGNAVAEWGRRQSAEVRKQTGIKS